MPIRHLLRMDDARTASMALGARRAEISAPG